MFILYATKNDKSIPVAVFNDGDRLAQYVNALTKLGSTTIDPVLKAQSVLAGSTDHQVRKVSDVWSSDADWVAQLTAAGACVFDPPFVAIDSSALSAEKIKQKVKLDAAAAEIAKIDAILGSK